MTEFARACDREPIHIPGCIQPFGVMVVCDHLDTITAVSSNSADLLDAEPKDLLGRSASVLRPRRGKIAWHEHAGCQVGEMEPTDAFLPSEAANNEVLRAGVSLSLSDLDEASDVLSLCQRVVQHIQALSGFERVMLYRFDPDWHGEVMAEARHCEVDSYLGQRFPASDIPAQARAMLAVNRVRMIPDTRYTPVPLVVSGRRPVDMGMSLLRSVSPVHLEYLANMGVGASLTLSIICEHRLWGLIACHQRTPRYAARVTRDACEIVARAMSSLLLAKAQMEEDHTRQRLRAVNNKLQQHISKGDDFIVGLVRHSPNILDLVLCEGCSAAICFDDKWTLLGEVPSVSELRDLLTWLAQYHPTDEVFFTEQLPLVYPPAERFTNKACGLMAVSLPKREGDYVLWFLPEMVQTIPWAGQPEKVPSSDGLHPRKSFRLWTEVVRGRSRRISRTELEAAAYLRKAIVEADLDRQFSREREARIQMTRERHRLAFLAEAGAVLAESLDTQKSLVKFARMATSAICDWCVIYLQRDGVLERAVMAHATPQGQEVTNRLSQFPGLHTVNDSPLQDVFQEREPVLISRATSSWCERLAPNPAYADYLQHQLGVSSLMAVPLVARDQLLGVLKLAWASPSTRYCADDVSWIKEVARRLAHAIDNAMLYQRSQQAIQAREHVLGVVSHDLRNPLGAIQLSADRLRRLFAQDSDVAERAATSLERIERACRRMHRLVEDMLNVARLEAGTLALDKTMVPAGALLQDVVDMLEPLASERSVHLEVRNLADACQVCCEPERLMQVFSNLVGNAIKFTPAGGHVVVELTAARTPTFVVRDTGPGIALADQAHIFDRFWQANRTARQGAGLGLAIAKGIVEAHGGEIWVQSQEGHGAAFYFTVPS